MFTEKDKELALKLAGYLGQMKVPEIPMKQLSDFYQCMIWYNELLKKIDEHIFELKKVTEPKQEKSKKASKEEASKEVK